MTLSMCLGLWFSDVLIKTSSLWFSPCSMFKVLRHEISKCVQTSAKSKNTTRGTPQSSSICKFLHTTQCRVYFQGQKKRLKDV